MHETVQGALRPIGIEARALADDPQGLPTATLDDPFRLASYVYDAEGRLTGVTRHLAPAPGNPDTGGAFTVSLAYQDATNEFAELAQSDGAGLTSASMRAAGCVRSGTRPCRRPRS